MRWFLWPCVCVCMYVYESKSHRYSYIFFFFFWKVKRISSFFLQQYICHAQLTIMCRGPYFNTIFSIKKNTVNSSHFSIIKLETKIRKFIYIPCMVCHIGMIKYFQVFFSLFTNIITFAHYWCQWFCCCCVVFIDF